MSALLKIYDKNLGKERQLVQTLKVVSEKISIRDLIRQRVEAEAKSLNDQLSGEVSVEGLGQQQAKSLVVPGFVETVLNGHRRYGRIRATKASEKIDIKQQIEVAFLAFEKNQFLMLFDDRQVTDLDQEVAVTETSVATFIRLTPLVGG
jgi:hypothetical protein